ncbi:hypothetical protein BDV98DRAFT_659634 [Pterulicium gracile]|uniref:Uncharacterized protein n=1 Tax=Pterulicium gracile TaxID=1884261 RepID=A0A5C3Q0H4_9AGAR|nr:hypothetical protein BDV98DRAFT_659634 [Pterula gracilis]
MEPDTSLCPDPESQSTSDSQTLGSFNQSLGTLRTGMASAELVMKDLRERISSMQRAADKLYPENHHVNLPPTHLTRKSRHGPSPAEDGINAGFFSRLAEKSRSIGEHTAILVMNEACERAAPSTCAAWVIPRTLPHMATFQSYCLAMQLGRSGSAPLSGYLEGIETRFGLDPSDQEVSALRNMVAAFP